MQFDPGYGLLDMGKQVKIIDLARNMIRLAGLIPDKDIQIEYVGMRPGEKLYEELLIEGEDVLYTSNDKIKICQGENGIDKEALYNAIEDLKRIENDFGSQDGVLDIIEGIVPRYSCSSEPVADSVGNRKILETRVSGGGSVDQKRRIG